MDTLKAFSRWRLLAAFCLVAAIVAAFAVACGSGESGTAPSPQASPSPQGSPSATVSSIPLACPTLPPPSSVPATGNVLGNPGFEDGRDPWCSLKPPDFQLSDVAHSGNKSAYLNMREPAEAVDAKVFYLVQEVLPTEFPEVLSGYYRVDNWLKGTEKQYLQFVVIAFAAANRPPQFPNHQIRYILAGIDQDPFAIANAKFVYLSKGEPQTGEWVPFKVNVKQDFIDLWGAAPEGYDRIRLLYEVRYDGKLPGSGTPEADVYYDDLYFGPAAGAP